jgi:hypothetical protein
VSACPWCTRPLMGAVALNLGYAWIFFCAALLSITGLGLTLLLKQRAGA